MSGIFLPLVFIFIPVLIFLYMAAEIHSRDRRSILHRWTAFQVATYALMEFGYFLINVLPEDLAQHAAEYVAGSSWFLNILSGFLFLRAFIKFRIPPVLIWGGSLGALAGLAAVLTGFPGFEVSVLSGTVWRSFDRGYGLGMLVSVLSAYSLILTLSCYWLTLRRLKTKPWAVNERQRIKLFLISIATMMTGITLVESLREQIEFSPYISIDLINMYLVFIYVGALRYSMINYDFLSSTARRYELLFSRSPIGISIFNDQGILLDANSAYLRILGIADLPDNIWRNSLIRNYAAFVDSGDAVSQMNEGFRKTTPLRLERRLTNRISESYFVDKSVSYFEMDGEILAFAMTQDITAQKASEEKLAFLAYHDPLTRLGNRRSFYEKLAQELNRLTETNDMLAVLLIDLDHFKWINDSLGHHAGDELLCSVTERLMDLVPENGSLARLGGDEFALLLPGICAECEAEALARELIVKLRNPFTLEGRPYQITVSVGISFSPRDGSDTDELLRNADMAMYGSKKEGRDRYETFKPRRREAANKTLVLVNGLKNALEKDEFNLHYQPQIDLRNGRLIGVEALIRWHSAVLGAVLPGDFIPLAEEYGAIVPIGDWVLRTAIRQGKRLIESGYSDLVISVNVSAGQLKDRQLAGQLEEVLRENDFPAGSLCLEITETSAMDDMEQSLQVCQEIVELGVSLALDDFGTGYSSLGMLSRFPFRKVKIDKSLIHEIETNLHDVDVIQTIVKLSGIKGMEVIAEGVETEWQMELLRRFGCHTVQGYLLGRPMPAGELYDWTKKLEERVELKFRNFEGIEVAGSAMIHVLDGLGDYRSVAIRYLEEGGLGVPERGQWYPLPEWLMLFRSLSERLGSEAMLRIGKSTSENLSFPAVIDNMEAALGFIDVDYRLIHRGVQDGRIGLYDFARTGDRSARLVSDSPYPCDFDSGVIEGVSNKFKNPASIIRIVHDESSCRKHQGARCIYHIAW